MSTALASARRRRAGPEVPAPMPGVKQSVPQSSMQQTQQNMGQGLTLPQVIALVDKRLITLETFMQTQSEMPTSENKNSSAEIPNNFESILEEYNTRFDIIADELASLKDTLMKLQTYTMEVNKTLMDERVRILSDESTPLEKALTLVGHQ